MIITIKIDAGKSIELFRQLLYDDNIEIIQIRSDPEPVIVVGSWHDLTENSIQCLLKERKYPWIPETPYFMNPINDILPLMGERESPLLIGFKNRFDESNLVCDVPNLFSRFEDFEDFEDIFHYPGDKSSWFIRLLSLTCRKARFRYLVAILIWMSRLLTFVVKGPFIKTLFYRKCFMVLKDFRNIRRCYQF